MPLPSNHIVVGSEILANAIADYVRVRMGYPISAGPRYPEAVEWVRAYHAGESPPFPYPAGVTFDVCGVHPHPTNPTLWSVDVSVPGALDVLRDAQVAGIRVNELPRDLNRAADSEWRVPDRAPF